MIDRINERNTLKNIYKDNIGKSTILIIYARTGIGKSFLIDSVFSKINNASYIRVKINQREAEETKGAFISNLAQAINESAHKLGQFITIEEFIKSIFRIDINKEKVISDLLDILADLTKTKVIKSKLDYYLKYKNDLIKSILKNDNDISVSFLIEYITYIAEKNNIIICIENIHHANYKFISIIIELLSRSKRLFLIGEYTFVNSEDEVINFFKLFDSKKFEVMELQKLEKGEILGALKHTADSSNREEVIDIIENSYDYSQGNLRNLEWLLKKNYRRWKFIKSNDLESIHYDDALHLIYDNLNNNQKMVLYYIVAHLGKVHQRIFTDSIKTFNINEEEIINGVKFLSDVELIENNNETISLKHDSMFELLKEENDYFKFISIANTEWLNFYKRLTISNGFYKYIEFGLEKYDALILQLTFIINIGGSTNVDWMNYILSQIDSSLNSSTSTSLLSKITSIFYQVIENNSNKQLIYKTYEWIVIILYKLGYSKEICRIMAFYNPPKPSDLLFLLQSSARISNCDFNVNKELELITNEGNHFLYTGAQLLLVRYYRTFNQLEKSAIIWTNLLKLNRNTPYTNNILEYANLSTFNVKKRLEHLRIAELGYVKSQNNYHLCSVLLNIIANTSYLYFFKRISKKKFIDISSKNIEKVKELIPSTYFPIHVYLNQKSVVQLIIGNSSDEILMNNFRTAYLNCGVEGNKPLIASNVIGIALKQNILLGIENQVQELMENSRKYSRINVEFARYPLINCYKYFYRIGDKEGQNEVIHLFKQGKILGGNGDLIVKNLFFLKTIFSRMKYYPTNIINWDIDFQFIQNSY